MPIAPLPSLTIATLLKRDIRPVILLGAGASARSGIPLTDALVTEIAKWGYCKTHARDMDDPTLMLSDWAPWQSKQPWFRHDVHRSENYARAVEAVLQPREDRKSFFQRVLNPGVPASPGYELLALLLARRVLRTVLTTNFDSILAEQCRSNAAVYQITEIKTTEDYRRFSTNPRYPQIIYLHGSIEHYTDQNIEQETQRLNTSLVELLSPLLRDHPLVVIGYRGAEPSVMRHLLAEQSDRCGNFKHGIYWCQRGVSEPPQDSMIAELVRVAGTNFQFVEIGGFDELMDELRVALPQLLTAATIERLPASAAVSGTSTDVHDLQASQATLADLDQALLRAKLLAYCEAARLPKPPISTEAQLVTLMQERSLAVRKDPDWVPTQGGVLLFAGRESAQIASASVEIVLEGESRWLDEILQRTPSGGGPTRDSAQTDSVRIMGNLWEQLDTISTLLARVNRPFRLKGATSHDVYPYPPLALKELLTNLLAHRDYTVPEASSIHIASGQIRFRNPGGLIEHVRAQLHSRQLQAAIEDAARGIKGYRNPVIADFFFSAGAMEKEGSGLPDVVSEAAQNLNEVTFGPTPDNAQFQVVIEIRPEALHIDRTTGTARPLHAELRYSPNLLSVLRWPDTVWKIATIASLSDLAVVRGRGAPPFCVMRDWIWTFAKPDSPASAELLALGLPEETHEVRSAELLDDSASRWALPHLLNSALERHLVNRGLRVRFEADRLRAYFPATNNGPTEVTYRGLFKQATRTVAKPIISRATQKTVFWEHKAVGLRFERFGSEWCLAILPGYAFTRDGDVMPIESDRIGPLSTRRAARDYNPTVLHDLVFWSRVIANGAGSSFCMELSANGGLSEEVKPRLEVSGVVPTVLFQEPPEVAHVGIAPTEMAEPDMLALQSEIEQLLADADEEDQEVYGDQSDGR